MPAQAGTQLTLNAYWFPAFAGMTELTWPFLTRQLISGRALNQSISVKASRVGMFVLIVVAGLLGRQILRLRRQLL